MRRSVWALLAALCILLLVFSEQALESAQQGLLLWWRSVLPALFPFYVLTSMLYRSGAFAALSRLFSRSPLPCLLFGGVAGTPTGARVCVLLGLEPYAACCNLMSPMFLLGVVSLGLCGERAVFLPLALSHYGGALLLLLGTRLLSGGRSGDAPVPAIPAQGGAMEDIADGMRAMLTVGGCIVFFYTIASTAVSALLHGRAPALSAMVVGLAEVTAGCARIAELLLPARLKLGMLAFVTSFGGVCILAQTVLVAGLTRPGRYLVGKLAHGCLSALIAYAIAPLFPGCVSVWSDASELYAQNALMGMTFLVSMGLGLLTSYLAALLMQRARAARPGPS